MFLLFIALGVNAQVQKNEAEHKVFNDKRVPQEIKRFNGDIAMASDTEILYDGELLVFEGEAAFLPIFTLGILYPSVVHAHTMELGEQITLDSATVEAVVISKEQFENLVGIKNLTFTNMRELTELNSSPKIKRFSFWLKRKGLMNPTVYYFELTNKKAKATTSLSNFIKGSKLTLIKAGSLII